ncbi:MULTISPECIES: DUF58 domain-containing protein [unclassified Actinomyces]|uniref:DUF58 domain-containing protein n=1 Tax=unclassified Actinomyces TaxID=2609248 RepID=UPI00201726D3|nr:MULTISPECIES: DUF58 domain-containing protein [unclassified Actinomyces]MCL3778654.1 DUF58 domain-containing protein [Actinomyces sp. AC-20-1]MCL3790576.1 DUF58 domain-containing protein [Actinomyces sp. 187325]MCL3792873.1 DUF58 domain-containing protein [Actinomyces sp. 186855]MCL3795339.1 DUF58 domain-containing protein [Actinomyces sp. 217892]
MYLTTRSAWLTGVGLLLVLLVPRPLTVLTWCAVVALLVTVDVLAAPSPRGLRLERSSPRTVRLGEETTTRLSVTSTSSRTMRLLLRDAWPPSAGACGERSTLTLRPGERRRTRTALRPTRRGDRVADLVTVRSSGPLGLAGRQLSVAVPARLRVLPPFTSRRHLPSRLARLREMDGRSAVMVRGAGTEFDSLREYVVGDDVRSIDWRSTARRGDVVVRTWRPERDRRVLLVVDTGRMSAARVGGAPRLDTEVETALLLAALASHAGDRVDAVAVDERLRAQVSGVAGPGLISALADALAPVEASVTETDWALVGRAVSQRLSQRALVVVLTGLDGSSADAVMTRVLTTMAREHTVLLASVTDPDLEALRRARADADSVYTAAAAERDLLELAAVRERLRRAGVEVVEALPGRLAPRVADTYLALKRAGRL